MKFVKVFLAALAAFVVGTFVCFFLWILVLVGMAGSMGGGSAEPVTDNSILKIDFSEVITDSPSVNPFASIDFQTMKATPQLSLYSALRAIDAAATDDRNKGIYLRMNGMGGVSDTAQAEELRATLAQFKESGKFIISYNETYSQGQYYLATVADKIYMQPEGSFDWMGMASQSLFFKGLLDKLGVEVEIFRPTVCKYKSAVEPYFLTKMSPENRAQMQSLINSIWGTITTTISEARGISVEELGVEKGLDDELNFVSLGGYAAQVGADVKKMTAPAVAVVYAEGQIVDGEGTDGNIYGNTLAAKIREVRLDEDVKAVVLRVNSPGGSALASDLIWREMELLKAEKPVIVSMGGYAASGGYYISAPADGIVADKTTLTGSIGVFGMIPNAGKALEKKLGITVDVVKTNTSAGVTPFTPMTSVEKRALMRSVDRVYERFTGLVAEGRNLPLEKVLDIAGGRVWSGEEALKIGLVDMNGGLKEAIAVAVEKAGLGEDYRIEERVELPTGLAAYMSAFSARVKASWEASELGVAMKEYRHLQEAMSQTGVVMYSPYKVEF